MRLLKRLSITAQFILLSIFAIVIMAIGTGASLYESYKLDIATQQSNVLAIDNAAKSIVEHYVALAQAGELKPEAAQKAALAAVSSLRYGDGNYVFVTKYDGTVLAEANPALIGTNFMVLHDSHGKVFIPAMIQAAAQGRVFFQHYYFPLASGGPAEPKISAMVAIPQWGWALGTGVYTASLLTSVLPYTADMLPYMLPLGIIYLLAILASCGQIHTMLQRLSATMRELGMGQLDVAIPYTERTDQIGEMAVTLAGFRESAEEKNRLEAEAVANRKAQEQAEVEQAAEARDRAVEQAGVVNALGAALNGLAKGNLSTPLEASFPAVYEQLRKDYNLALAHLRETMQAIDHSAMGVRHSADEIMQAADDLSRRTEQQAAALEETTAALDSVTATVRQTADSAGDALKVVNDAHNSATHSGTIMKEAVSAMSGIADSSRQIGDIIGVIDEIAFQTNLLALNAGVEAARAGNAGRGFAVVATEVRALAQRSANAAKEIKTLISKSGAQVNLGVRLVGETGDALSGIAGQVENLNGMMKEIARSAGVQATGLAEVNGAMNQMDQMTQQNAAMVEETTAASHALSSEAKGLEGLISQFNLGARTAQPKQNPAVMADTVRKVVPPAPVAPAPSAPVAQKPAKVPVYNLPPRATPSVKPAIQDAPAGGSKGKVVTFGQRASDDDGWDEF